jgi:hypothetical protein
MRVFSMWNLGRFGRPERPRLTTCLLENPEKKVISLGAPRRPNNT